jgi:cytochrome P450
VKPNRAEALPPGPSWSVQRQTLAWTLRPAGFLDTCARRHGGAFTIELVHTGRWVLLSDPHAVEDVFALEAHRFSAADANAVLRPVLGSGSLLLLDGAAHHSRRKTIVRAMRDEEPDTYERLIGDVVRRRLARLPLEAPVRLLPWAQALTLDAILAAVLGRAASARASALRSAVHALLARATDPRALGAVLVLGTARAKRLTRLASLLSAAHAAIDLEIERCRRDPRVDGQGILARLLADAGRGPRLSNHEIREQLMTLLIAGHETTAAAIAWTVEQLLRSPAALTRLRAAIAAGDRTYLDAVCRESLRLRPVLPIVGRRLLEDARLGRWTLPAGTRVAPCPYLVHRRPDLFPAPLLFRPERFIEQQQRHARSWIPFGGGARRCPGASFALLEMRAVVAAIVAHAELRPVRPERERVRRRVLVWAPSRGAEAVLTRATNG